MKPPNGGESVFNDVLTGFGYDLAADYQREHVIQMSAERIVGTAENRKYHRASVLWPATLLCRNNSFECVIFNISANGAKLMIKNSLEDKARVTLSSSRFGAFDGDIVWRSPHSLGIRFLLAPEQVAEVLGDKLPLLPAQSDENA
jgi:PilZ domain